MEEEQKAPFHVLHKVPAGDGLYVRAKHVQLVERNPSKAIHLFRAALEAGDRSDSALKDMAIVLKQQNRPQDAILAILTFRACCSDSAQDSLDNVLLDLYKSCGRLDDQISLLIRKLKLFTHSQTFNGKRTKTARSQGKKFQVSVEQETARLLGNLGWAYMQQSNFSAAESVYRKALALEVDNNKLCNLGVCLMKQGRAKEAIAVLQRASYLYSKKANSESHLRSYERAQDLMRQASSMLISSHCIQFNEDDTASYTSTSSSNSTPDGTWHESLPIDVSNSEDARKMSQMVAAAWLHTCGTNAQEDEDAGVVDGGHRSKEDSIISMDQAYGDTHSLFPTLSSLQSPLSGDLSWSSQGRRRLPVFRDITVLGSAAAY